MKNKILMIAERVPFPADNGGKLRTSNMLINLSKKYDVDFVCYSAEKKDLVQLDVLNKYCNDSFVYSEGTPSKLKHLKYFLLGRSGIACAVYSKKMQSKINELVNKNNYSLIWVERLFCFPYLFSLKKNAIPIILNMHDVDHEAVRFFGKVELSWLKRVYFKFEYWRVIKLEKCAFERSNRIIAVSERDRELYCNKFLFSKNKWLVANNGVDLSISHNATYRERKNNMVLFIGGLDNPCNRHGLLWFLDNVWTKVIQKCPDALLYIAGSGKNADIISEKCNALNNTVFLGYIKDVVPLYQEASCLIVPLLSGSGTRLKIVEAFSFNTPVISTSIGAEGLPVSSGRELLIADSVNDFSNGIIKILSDRKFSLIMASNGYTVAKKYYDWNVIMNNLLVEIEHSI